MHYKEKKQVVKIFILASLVTSIQFVYAEEVQQNKVTTLPTIEVYGVYDHIRPFEKTIKKELSNVAGGTNFINTNKIEGKKTYVKDYLNFQPGIEIYDFFGGNDHPTISIRGSGINNHPNTNGVLMLQNGLPFNAADGSFLPGLLDFGQSNLIVVRRGSNASHPFSNTLGGEIEYYTRSGVEKERYISVDHGSFDSTQYSGAFGSELGDKADLQTSFSSSKSKGFAKNNRNKRVSWQGNITVYPNEHFQNMLGINLVDSSFQIPGPRTLDMVYEDPSLVLEKSIPFITITKPNRKSNRFGVTNRSLIVYGNVKQDIGFYFNTLSDLFTTPVFERGDHIKTFGIQYKLNIENPKIDYGLAASWSKSDFDTRYQVNPNMFIPIIPKIILGKTQYKGKADLLSIQPYFLYKIRDNLKLSGQLRWVKTTRKMDENRRAILSFLLKENQMNNEWEWLSPRLGLVWDINPNHSVFMNYSKSKEAPTFYQMTQFVLALPPHFELMPLKPQSSQTYEIGARGNFNEKINYDLSLYRSDVKNAIIEFSPNGFSIYGMNHDDKAVFKGAELGLSGSYLIADELSVTGRLAYNYYDYRYKGGMFAGNKVAGIPKNTVGAEFLLKKDKLSFGPNIRSHLGKIPTDHGNQVFHNGYTVWGMKLVYEPNDNVSLYVQGDNLSNKYYVASTTTPTIANSISFAYFPGAKRSLNAGIKFNF